MSDPRQVSRCPHPSRVQAHAMGALPVEWMKELDRHLATCGACRMLSEGFAGMDAEPVEDAAVAGLRARIEPELAAARASEKTKLRWRRWAWVAIPAAAAALLLIGLPALRSPRAKPVPVISKAPALDVEQLAQLEPAPVRLPVEDVLITRGAGASRLTPELTAAFQAYQRESYEEATLGFHGIAEPLRTRYEVSLYEGVSLLLSGRAAESIAPLEIAKTRPGGTRVAEARWYLALARLRTGEVAAARAELDALCRQGAEQGRIACEALRRLTDAGG